MSTSMSKQSVKSDHRHPFDPYHLSTCKPGSPSSNKPPKSSLSRSAFGDSTSSGRASSSMTSLQHNNTLPSTRLERTQSDATLVVSNMSPPFDRFRGSQQHDGPLEELLLDPLDDSASMDDLTISRINVSDTELMRSESPGCLRLTESGLRAHELQAENQPPLVAPPIIINGSKRCVNPLRSRPPTANRPPQHNLPLYAQDRLHSSQSQRSVQSQPRTRLETCHEKKTTHSRRFFPFRTIRDISDSASVTPLVDTDKIVGKPKTRRGLFCLGGSVSASASASGSSVASRSNGSKSVVSAASQRHLQQMSAQECRERQRLQEERERRRIEARKKAYLQQQRAKDLTSRDNDVVPKQHNKAKKSSSSSPSKKDSNVERHSLKRDSTNKKKKSEQSSIFRDFGFILTETCPVILGPNEISTVGSSSTTSAAALMPPCVVCHINDRSHIATACMHFVYCSKCAHRLSKCVVCQQPSDFRPVNL